MDYTQMNRQPPILTYKSDHSGYTQGSNKMLLTSSFCFSEDTNSTNDILQKMVCGVDDRTIGLRVVPFMFSHYESNVYAYLFSINFMPEHRLKYVMK